LVPWKRKGEKFYILFRFWEQKQRQYVFMGKGSFMDMMTVKEGIPMKIRSLGWLVVVALMLLAGAWVFFQREDAQTVTGLGVTLENGGKAVRIALASNPSTGYVWSYRAVPEGMLVEVTQEYIPAPVPPGYVGAGGTQVYVFAGKEGAGGNVILFFEEARPWEEGVIQTYRVALTVKEDGTLSQM